MKIDLTIKEFIECYNSMSYVELKENFGLNSNQVSQLAKAFGLAKKKGRRKQPLIFRED